MPDVMAVCDAVLHSIWLLPLLTVMIGADGPLPVLPGETLLMSAAAAAFGRHDLLAVVGLFLALVGARFVPGGRLVSTAAAGRFGLSLRPFLLWSPASSAVYGGYMLAVGMLLGPLAGGNPLLSLAGGLVMATATAAGFALAARLRRPRRTWAVHVRVPEAVPAG